MKLIILGGMGFLGRNLIDYFSKRDNEIIVFDCVIPAESDQMKNCTYISCDFADLEKHGERFRDADAVFHLISTMMPYSSNLDIGKDVRENLLGTISLLELCANKGVKHVIFPSSGGTVYGVVQETPIVENHPADPICSYGIIKLAIEKYMYLFFRQFGMNYTALRISNPYGPHQNTRNAQGALSTFLWKNMHHEPIEIWGEGNVVRDYIFVSDVVHAFEASLLLTPEPPHIYNIGCGKGYSLNDLVRLIDQVTGNKSSVKYLPARAVDVPISVLDTALAKKHMHWEASVSIEEGIKRTYQYFLHAEG